jgi:hypothetical protein
VSLWNDLLVEFGVRSPQVRHDETAYPPYELISACPKCTSTGDDGEPHSTSFCAPTLIWQVQAAVLRRPELIRRTCNRCCASWFQLPADASPEAES